VGSRSEHHRWWPSGAALAAHHPAARAAALAPGAARLLWRLPTREAAAALTFDDGPHPGATAALLELLRAHGVRASFFVLTNRLDEHGSIVREAAAAGHRIGLHGDRHEKLVRLPSERAARRLSDARRRLEDELQAPVALYRPPHGGVSLSLLRAARRAGLEVALWSHDPRDWAGEEFLLAPRLRRCLRPGAVVLLHDRCYQPRLEGWGALAQALALAAERGLSLLPLPQRVSSADRGAGSEHRGECDHFRAAWRGRA
jgi:peptidoglycan/xylan/chitin deacetylase (PgdA/CDA1 family)